MGFHFSLVILLIGLFSLPLCLPLGLSLVGESRLHPVALGAILAT